MKIDKERVLAIISIIGTGLLVKLTRTSACYNFFKNNLIMSGLLISVFLFFVLYLIFRSIYNNGFRKHNIKKLIYWCSLISIIILFVYSIYHFSLYGNHLIILICIAFLVIIYFLVKEIDNDCVKNIGLPIGLFVGCFSLFQISLFAEKKYSSRYFSEGKIAFQEHNYPEAIENFKIYINFHKEKDSSYYYTGQSNLKLCKFNEAVINFKKIKSTNFNYRKDILTELLDYSINYLSIGEIDNWQNIDKKFKDTLLVNLSDYELSMNTNNKEEISLKKVSYLNDRWSKFRNLSVKYACNQIPCEISEKNFFYFTNLLMISDKISESEAITKYFGKIVKDEQINKLIVMALKQNWILSLSEYKQNPNELWIELEEFRIKLQSK